MKTSLINKKVFIAHQASHDNTVVLEQLVPSIVEEKEICAEDLLLYKDIYHEAENEDIDEYIATFHPINQDLLSNYNDLVDTDEVDVVKITDSDFV